MIIRGKFRQKTSARFFPNFQTFHALLHGAVQDCPRFETTGTTITTTTTPEAVVVLLAVRIAAAAAVVVEVDDITDRAGIGAAHIMRCPGRASGKERHEPTTTTAGGYGEG